MTKFLRVACALALATVGLSAVAEPKGPEYAVVTCADDGTDLGSGKITLREAVLAMADPAFTNAAGARVVTFRPDADLAVKLDSPLVVAEGTRPFAIDGGANDRCVTIRSAGGCRLIEHRGHGLELRNLQFEGGAAAGAGGAIHATGPASVTNQTLTVSNCFFSANAAQDGGAIAAESNTVALVQCCTFYENVATNVAGAVRTAGRLTAVNCTFCENWATGAGAGALAAKAGGELLVAKCTVLAGVGTGGGLHVASGAKATVCDSLLLCNVASETAETMSDTVNDGSLVLYASGLSSAPTGSGTTVRPKEDCDFNVNPESLVSTKADPVSVVHGVTNVVFAVVYCAASTNGAGVLWSDAAWTNVAVGSATAPASALCGSKDLATVRRTEDQTGTEDRPARGALRHGFVNRLTFVVAGQPDRVVEADCGSAEVPFAPAVLCVGGVLKGWYSEPDGKGVVLWNEGGSPDPTNLPKVPYEPLVAYAVVEQSDAAYTVSDGGDGTRDDGKVTLRMLVEAMTAHPEWKGSAGRRVITVPASVGTVSLASTLSVPSGTKPFVIRGAWDGTNAVTIKAQGSGYRLFLLENEKTGFENLTFQGANSRETDDPAGGGGAILATGSCELTVSNCAFRSNSAVWAGGAVRLMGSGTFERCSFHENRTINDGGHGAAVSVDGDGSAGFRNCSFTLNSPTGISCPGGAVYGANGDRCTFAGCTFVGNRASEAGAVAVGGGVPLFDGCLAVSNSPSVSVSPAFTNMSGEVLSEGGRTFDRTVGGANHAYVRPVPCGAVTNAPDAAGNLDLLGSEALAPGLGAVRGEYGIRLVLNPGDGGRVLDDIRSLWGQCGRSCEGLLAPPAQRDGATFLGWWTAENRAGEQAFDKEGRPLGGLVLPLAEQMTLHAGWKTELGGLEVTTADDTSGVVGKVSLRDAVRKIVENAADIGEGEMPTVTFALNDQAFIRLASPLEIPANVPPFAIDGANGGAAVTLAASGAGLDALVKANGRGLVLRNLMFSGDACADATVVSANGALAVENCAFDVAGRPLSAANAQTLVSGCSFSETTGALVCHARTNTLVNVVHFGAAPGAAVDCTGDSLVLQGTFAKADACVGVTAVNSLCGERHLAGTNRLSRTGGVDQLWRPALYAEAATNCPGRIWHDAAWANVAREQAGGKVALRGAADLATLALETDLLGQADVRPANGAVRSRFALRYDLDANGGTLEQATAIALCGETPGTMPVPTRELHDFAGWFAPDGTPLFDAKGDPCEGVTAPWQESLRLVAGWAAKPELLIVGNEAEFRAALAALTNAANHFADRTITMKRDITLGGDLNVEPTVKPFAIDGKGFVLKRDGVAAAPLVEHRGMGLVLRNLTLREIKSRSPGGVVRAYGPFRAENCRFEGNSAESGGALCFENATNVVIDCTFVGNTATADGGAVCVKSGAGVIVHCTFVDNRAEASGDAVCASGSGRLGLLACSFSGSAESGGVKGFVQAGGTSEVKAAGCAFANRKSGAGDEISAASGATMTVESCTFTKVSSLPASWNGCFVAPLADVFLDGGSVKSRKAGNVTHACVQPALTVQMAGGVWVWHDVDWANVAYGLGPNRDDDLREVLGDPAACPLRKSTDQVGMEFSSLLVFRGAVTALAANEIGLEVTTAKDVVDPTDGLISLREAIRSAASGELDPGDDGRFTITFADSLFAATNRVTVELACTNDLGMIQPTADIVIQGRTDGRSVELAVRNNQNAPVFKVDPGLRFALRNLTVGYTYVVTTAGTIEEIGLFDAGLIHASGDLEMTDCLFEGCRQAFDAPMVQSFDGGVATIERCSFVGSGRKPERTIVDGGILKVHSGANMRVIDCTFANLVLKDSDGRNTWAAVEAQASGRATHLAVVNCTFFGNRGSIFSGGVYVVGKEVDVCVLNCIFNDNKNAAGTACDVYVDGANVCMRRSVYTSAVKAASGGTTTALMKPVLDECEQQSDVGLIFAGPMRRTLRGGVLRAFRAPKLFGPADRHGCYVWHDAAWTNVAISARYVNTTDKTNVVGAAKSKGLATTLAGRYDVVCRDALEGINPKLGVSKDRQATMGSYTTPLDGEGSECGELVVTDPTDDGQTETEHDSYDGKLSLREAVDFANTHPYWRDTNGNCRVTFGGEFTNASVRTVTSRMRQMEVTGFTNGTLSVVGPESGCAVMLDGGGAHRLFHVASGNGLSLQNLNFTNAVSQKAGACQTLAGGAINSKGRLAVRNCSFRDCRTFQNPGALWGAVYGRAYGGAVCTETGGSTVIEQCTFLGCQAMNGGAVCADAGGETVLAASVFADNVALDAGGAGFGCGGAVCALDGAGRMSLVNCTLTRNLAQRRGGAIAAGRTRDALGRSTTALYLLDSIVLGNGAPGDADSGDIRLDGLAKVARCWLGRRNDAGDDRMWTDDAVISGKVPADIFGRFTEDGVALASEGVSRGAWHAFFPLCLEVDAQAAFVWTFDGWANVGYSPDKNGMRQQSVLYARDDDRLLKTRGVPMTLHQLGNAGQDRALMGATAEYVPRGAPVPDENVDPLRVTNGTFRAFCDVLAFAATHTGDLSLVSNGCLTVTFAEPYVIDVTSNLVLSAFASPKLRIVGPVTFRGGGTCRPFTVAEGNALVLENVAFEACRGNDGNGGAIYLKTADLTASHVTFTGCTSCSESYGFGDGGAVCASTGSSAAFIACAFTNNVAVGSLGQDIYRYESTVTLVDCSFKAPADERLQAEVKDWLNALLIAADPPGRRTYFSTVDEALTQCRKGDALVLLNPNGPDERLVREKLPPGVTLKVYADEESVDALEFVRTMADDANAAFVSKSEPWYTATVRETDGMVMMDIGLNDLAKPGLGEVDFNAADGTTVSVWPTDVRPGLVYGLGRSESPTGPFVVEEDGWVRADANGNLPRALTAPKGDSGGFYRVIVRE